MLNNRRPTYWKIAVGMVLIFVEIRNHLAPVPNLLKPKNESEALGMLFAAFVVSLVGFWLIISGIRGKEAQASEPLDRR